MFSGLLDRLKRQWRGLSLMVVALGAVASLLTAVAASRRRIGDALEALGLHRTWAVPVVLVFVAIVGRLVATVVQRAELERLTAKKDIRLRNTRAADMGVALSSRSVSNERPEPTYYERRVVDADIDKALTTGRLVVVVGDRVSGVSHTGYAGLRRRFRGNTRVMIPNPRGSGPEENLGALMEVTLPMRLVRTVVWVDDLGTRLLREETTARQVLGFLRRNRRTVIVGTLRSDQYKKLREDGGTISEAAQTIFAEASLVTVPHEFSDEDLLPVRVAYPDVPDERLRRLPEYLVAYDEQLSRYEQFDDSPMGHAILRAAADWVRCGCGRPVPLGYLRDAAPRYLPAPLRASADSKFDAGLEWAASPVVGSTVLLEEISGGSWSPSSVIVARVRNSYGVIPPFVWSMVLRHLHGDGDAVASVAVTAEAYGAVDAARGAWEAVLALNDHSSLTASNALVRLADTETSIMRSPRIPELLGQVRRRRGLSVLWWRGPAPMATSEAAHATGRFDPSPPRRVGGFAAAFYRLVTLRFILRVVTLVTLDAVGVVIGLAAAHAARDALRGNLHIATVVDGVSGLMWFSTGFAIVGLAIVGAYRAESRRARLDRIALAMTGATAVAAPIGIAHGEGVTNSTVAWAAFVFMIPACFALRAAYDRVSQKWVTSKELQLRTLLIGDRSAVNDVQGRLHGAVRKPMVFVGYLSNDINDDSTERVGIVADLPRVLGKLHVHSVVIADYEMDGAAVLEILDVCTLRGVRASLALSVEEVQMFRKRVPVGETQPVQRLLPSSLSVVEGMFKRAFDLCVGVAMLFVAAPLMALITILIRLESSGSALITPSRPGLGHQPFKMYKFRTSSKPGLDAEDGGAREDVTRVGAILRRLGLDELPQLFNVVGGTMSLVGPRPLPTADYKAMHEWHRRRYLVKPGLTGLWQISARPDDIDYDETAHLDLIYMSGWSLWRDFEILVRTVWTVVAVPTDRPTPHP